MEKQNKLGFFKRIKIAIFNLDEYGLFIEENLSVAIKYMFLIICIFAICLSIVNAIDANNMVKKGYSYLQNEFPDFTFDGENLKLEKYAYGYDEQFDIRIIADTTENLEKSQIDSYKKILKESKKSILLLEDKLIFKNSDDENEFTYKELNKSLSFSFENKADLLKEVENNGGISTIITTLVVVSIIVFIIVTIIEVTANILIVSIIGLIAGRICGIIMKGTVAGNLAIYSLTFPIFCKLAYLIIYNYTGFEIKNFDTMYLIIAYIYIIAAILIIKTDLMKQATELMRIKSEEEQIRDELKRKELEEKEQEEKNNVDNKDDEKQKKDKEESPKLKEPNKEPDGSEV